ncbi:MAG: peptidylprolyl isomerase [Proteobacteria bacterium]|nr:peptidylprolyl isomerase [Pseudomonadota bacterium]MCP4917654.1 peptidylprolyl isomerase [Pseudomonadota bacterium]
MALIPDTPAPPVDVPGEGDLHVTIKTTLGDITARLHEKRAPRTVANFWALATGNVEWKTPNGGPSTESLYIGGIMHRVIPEFMVQLGCPNGNGRGGPGYRFGDEIHPDLRHDKGGVMSMANSGPGTNGSQFFITEVPCRWLDGKHAVFGQVTDGLSVIKEAARVHRDHNDKPFDDIKIEDVTFFRQ